jgi:hypothetical protein
VAGVSGRQVTCVSELAAFFFCNCNRVLSLLFLFRKCAHGHSLLAHAHVDSAAVGDRITLTMSPAPCPKVPAVDLASVTGHIDVRPDRRRTQKCMPADPRKNVFFDFVCSVVVFTVVLC